MWHRWQGPDRWCLCGSRSRLSVSGSQRPEFGNGREVLVARLLALQGIQLSFAFNDSCTAVHSGGPTEPAGGSSNAKE